jgi:hypothetical protein
MKKWRLSTLTGTDQDIEDQLYSRKEIQYNNSCIGNKKAHLLFICWDAFLKIYIYLDV